MCKFLDVMLGEYRHVDNTRPVWLVNPSTGQALEIDRYYPQLGVGFEFQGDQHLRPVEGMTDNRYIWKLDKLKRDICMRKGVLIIPVEPIDLIQSPMITLYKRATRWAWGKRTRDKRRKFTSRDFKFLNKEATEYRAMLNEKYPGMVGTHRRSSIVRKEKLIGHGLRPDFSRKQLDNPRVVKLLENINHQP